MPGHLNVRITLSGAVGIHRADIRHPDGQRPMPPPRISAMAKCGAYIRGNNNQTIVTTQAFSMDVGQCARNRVRKPFRVGARTSSITIIGQILYGRLPESGSRADTDGKQYDGADLSPNHLNIDLDITMGKIV